MPAAPLFGSVTQVNRGIAEVIYQRTIEIPAAVHGNVAKLLFGGCTGALYVADVFVRPSASKHILIVITGTINLVFTFIAIGTVDHLGRRTLVLIGCAGIAACHTLLGIVDASGLSGPFVLLLTLAAIASYAMSLARITWVLISEIFPNRLRGTAVSVAVSVLWIACFLLTYTFPLLNGTLGPAGTFWTYGATCLGGWVFVWLAVPETKGKTWKKLNDSGGRKLESRRLCNSCED